MNETKTSETSESLREIASTCMMICENDAKFYNETCNRYMTLDNLVELVIKYCKTDINEDTYLSHLIKDVGGNVKDVIKQSLIEFPLYDDETIFVVNNFDEVANLLKVIDGKIVFPEVYFSNDLYTKVGEFLKTIGFVRSKHNKCVAYVPREEFSADDGICLLKKLSGVSLSTKFDFFPTPKEIVKLAQEHLDVQPEDYILEPSAGKGDLVAGIPVNQVLCNELNEVLVRILSNKGYKVCLGDFESFSSVNKFDKIIMNPPFGNRMDAKHAIKAFNEHLKDGGTLVVIHSDGINTSSDKSSKEFQDLCKTYCNFKKVFNNKEFKNSGKGTNVTTCLTVLSKGK